jgi:hypothetical protein
MCTLKERTYCISSYLVIVLSYVASYPSYHCCVRGMGQPSNCKCVALGSINILSVPTVICCCFYFNNKCTYCKFALDKKRLPNTLNVKGKCWGQLTCVATGRSGGRSLRPGAAGRCYGAWGAGWGSCCRATGCLSAQKPSPWWWGWRRRWPLAVESATAWRSFPRCGRGSAAGLQAERLASVLTSVLVSPHVRALVR